MVSACVLIRSERGKFSKAMEDLKKIRGLKRIFPVLGRYDIVVDLEAKGYRELAKAVIKIGAVPGVIFTETLIEVER